MKEVSAQQIAGALAGHPVGPGPELRLLMLFQSEAGDPGDVQPETVQEPRAKAA